MKGKISTVVAKKRKHPLSKNQESSNIVQFFSKGNGGKEKTDPTQIISEIHQPQRVKKENYENKELLPQDAVSKTKQQKSAKKKTFLDSFLKLNSKKNLNFCCSDDEKSESCTQIPKNTTKTKKDFYRFCYATNFATYLMNSTPKLASLIEILKDILRAIGANNEEIFKVVTFGLLHKFSEPDKLLWSLKYKPYFSEEVFLILY